MLLDLRIDGGNAPEIVTLSTAEVTALRGTLAQRKARMLDALAADRWARTQVFAYDGVEAAPADGALTAVIGVVVASQIAAPAQPIAWKLAPGVFRAWSVDQISDYGIAIRAHIQACFDREAELADSISAAATHAALDALDLATGWPG